MKRKTTNEVRREIEPELLSPQEQAQYAADREAELGQLRAEVQRVQAHASALNALIRCNGAFIRPDKIRKEMAALQKTVNQTVARHERSSEAVQLCA